MERVSCVFQHAALFTLIQDCAYKDVVSCLSSDSVRKLRLDLQPLKLHVRDLESAELWPLVGEDLVVAKVDSNSLGCLHAYTLANVDCLMIFLSVIQGLPV